MWVWTGFLLTGMVNHFPQLAVSLPVSEDLSLQMDSASAIEEKENEGLLLHMPSGATKVLVNKSPDFLSNYLL